jgi:asparagine synthase (glutamine-hydrolysing)
MSGFAGLVNIDGAPVSRAILERMAQSLVFRGPDAQRISTFGHIGLVHASLHVDSGRMAPQPATLGQGVWVVADARIDGRADLIDRLKSKTRTGPGSDVSLITPDAELILHAYAVWGQSCVEHLLGDFAFAIFDEPNRRLFCARDHFGVKLVYYSLTAHRFVFSNTLDCLRQHPSVSGTLNPLAIADFLLFDINQDIATTTFADVQMLPPAHTLTLEGVQAATRRYWDLPVSEPIRFRRDEEYIERFRALLDASVSDRVRSANAALLMSGGLDSSNVAASAGRVLARRGSASGLHAHTQVFDRLVPYEERHYAALVAKALQIPIEFSPGDEIRIFEGAELGAPEPVSFVLPSGGNIALRSIAETKRVVLTGQGGDPTFGARISLHFRDLYDRKQFVHAARDAARYLFRQGRLSRLYLRTRWGRLFRSKDWNPYPVWLNPEFERRLGLRERWEALMLPIPALQWKSVIPFLTSAWWSSC